jgi:hypothetical protein
VSGADHSYLGWYKLGEATHSWLALCGEAAATASWRRLMQVLTGDAAVEAVDVVPASRAEEGRPAP